MQHRPKEMALLREQLDSATNKRAAFESPFLLAGPYLELSKRIVEPSDRIDT
jgi:hypothetical protein